MQFLSKTRASLDSGTLLSVAEDEGFDLSLEEVRSIKEAVVNSLRTCKKKRLEPEEVKRCFQAGVSEAKLAVIIRAVDTFVRFFACLEQE